MNNGLISKRYAKALLEHSKEKGDSAELYILMKRIDELFTNNPRIKDALENPILPSSQKYLLITEIAGEDATQSFKDFAKLLLDHERESQLRMMALSYINLYRKSNNINVVSLTSASELPQDVVERICNDVLERTHGTIEINTKIDPSIEGGFIFKMNDLLLDASVKGQIERIRREFIKNNKTIV